MSVKWHQRLTSDNPKPVSATTQGYGHCIVLHLATTLWSTLHVSSSSQMVKWMILLLFKMTSQRNHCHMWWISKSWNVWAVWNTMPLDKIDNNDLALIFFILIINYFNQDVLHRKTFVWIFSMIRRWQCYVGQSHIEFTGIHFLPLSKPTRLWHLNRFWWFSVTPFFWTLNVW